MDEGPDEGPAVLQLDLQPSKKQEDRGPQKAIEYVALIRGAEPISRDKALGVYRQHEYTMEKHNGIYGFNIANGLWCDLEHEEQSSEYKDICLTIQLADYKGAVSETELHRFSQMSLEVAEELNRPILFSADFDEALVHAQDLDRFRKEMDIILVASIVARSEHGLSMTAIHREAEKMGLVYGKGNIYHRIRKNADNKADVLFSMANMFKPGDLPKDDDDMHTSGLTFFMRLVSVSNPVDVYTDMMKTASTLAKRLNGILIDQETAPINESMKIKQTKSIMKISSLMDAKEIPAGSELAKRLF
jgi:cell division protein ZipA